jgi:hypothetical protein
MQALSRRKAGLPPTVYCQNCARPGAKRLEWGFFDSEQCQEEYGRKLYRTKVVGDVLRSGGAVSTPGLAAHAPSESERKYCQNCACAIPIDAQTCPTCGAAQQNYR